MVDQEDLALDPQIQKYGCYFLSILFLSGKLQSMTVHDINVFRQSLLDNGISDITDDCTVENPEEVFKELGVCVRQIRNIDGSVVLPSQTETPLAGLEILCYYWPAKNFTHFMVGDGHGNIAYDPIHRGSNTAKFGKLKSKRLFALVTE